MKVRDAGRKTRTRDVAEKTLIAVYSGPEYVAEREGDELRIYSIGQDGVAGVKTGDSVVNDALSQVRKLRNEFASLNQAASSFWDDQRAKQGDALGIDRKR